MSQPSDKQYFDDPFEEADREIPLEETTDFSFAEPTHTEEEWQWALFSHMAGFGGFVIPFGSVLGPLVLWSMKKEQMPLVDTHGKRALNFNLTVILAALVCIPLIFVFVGIFLLIALGLIQLIATVMAVIAVSQHKDYRYPFSIRFLK